MEIITPVVVINGSVRIFALGIRSGRIFEDRIMGKHKALLGLYRKSLDRLGGLLRNHRRRNAVIHILKAEDDHIVHAVQTAGRIGCTGMTLDIAVEGFHVHRGDDQLVIGRRQIVGGQILLGQIGLIHIARSRQGAAGFAGRHNLKNLDDRLDALI
ncbi:hypothetical protein D3C73_1257800 [compost metagenome]